MDTVESLRSALADMTAKYAKEHLAYRAERKGDEHYDLWECACDLCATASAEETRLRDARAAYDNLPETIARRDGVRRGETFRAREVAYDNLDGAPSRRWAFQKEMCEMFAREHAHAPVTDAARAALDALHPRESYIRRYFFGGHDCKCEMCRPHPLTEYDEGCLSWQEKQKMVGIIPE